MNFASLRRSFPLLLLVLVAASARASDRTEDRVLGRYWMPDRLGQFEIYIEDDHFFGRVVAWHVEGQLDENNADASLRTRPFLGIDMLAGFRFDPKQAEWIDGTIYDGENGTTHRCSMWFEEDEPNLLVARGFIGFSFLGSNISFDRLSTE